MLNPKGRSPVKKLTLTLLVVGLVALFTMALAVSARPACASHVHTFGSSCK
jgi:hypothetical protein